MHGKYGRLVALADQQEGPHKGQNLQLKLYQQVLACGPASGVTTSKKLPARNSISHHSPIISAPSTSSYLARWHSHFLATASASASGGPIWFACMAWRRTPTHGTRLVLLMQRGACHCLYSPTQSLFLQIPNRLLLLSLEARCLSIEAKW